MKAEPLARTAEGTGVVIDLQKLIGTHLCVVANSGGGKSGLIRRLLETTHGQVQHLVLDVEDEFYTLRQRFDYVIAGGEGGDTPASPGNAGQLARAALEHGFSLIAQINDLGADGAPEFVGSFLASLMEVPRELWRPVLVVVDETQRFAPRLGDTAATAGVKDLLARGRKRGFTGVLASQSLPEIEPRVRGGVNNWLLGRAGTALDRKTVAGELGFAPSSAEARGLTALQREFWGYGPAIAPEPVLVRVADVATPMPRPGQAQVPTPPPAEALRTILQGLASPAPAEPQVDTPATALSIEELAQARQEGFDKGVAEGRRLEREEAAARPLAADPRSKRMVDDAVRIGAIEMGSALKGALDKAHTEQLARYPVRVHLAPGEVCVLDGTTISRDEARAPAADAPPSVPAASPPPADPPNPQSAAAPPSAARPLAGAALVLLNVIQAAPRPVTRAEACVLAQLSSTAGYTRTGWKVLMASGLVEEATDGRIWPLEPGAAALDRSAIVTGWAQKLGGAAARILRLLDEAGARTKEQVHDALSLSPTAGYTRTGWKALRDANLVAELDGGVWSLASILLELRPARG